MSQSYQVQIQDDVGIWSTVKRIYEYHKDKFTHSKFLWINFKTPAEKTDREQREEALNAALSLRVNNKKVRIVRCNDYAEGGSYILEIVWQDGWH